MKRIALIVLTAELCSAHNASAYTTNDWQEARAAYAAAKATFTNEMAKAAAAGIIARRDATLKAQNAALSGKRLSGGAATPALTKAQRSYFENRRICVSRDTTTLPGYVITTWHRNGKLDTKGAAVVTNRIQKIIGAEQKNPIQELAERMRQRAEEWQAAAETWRTTATNNAARIERVTAALDERRDEYVAKRDAAALPTTKAIYQAFIDAIDRIKAKLDGKE